MAISFDKALGLREHALQLRVQRAGVLSSNIANIDTPNFKARDIDFQSELSARTSLSATSAKATSQGHMQLKDFGEDSSQVYRIPSQPSIDGNTVEEHVEHAEFMKNSLEFQVAFQLLNSSFKGLRKAVRGE